MLGQIGHVGSICCASGKWHVGVAWRREAELNKVLHFGLKEWAHQDSNLGPSDYESDALTN
jgi:hypothetical protein